MTRKHTATPYKCGETPDGKFNGSDIYTADFSPIAMVFPQNHEQGVIDAEFIVRACNAHDELVSALDSLANEYEALMNRVSSTYMWNIKPLYNARALVTKARGEA